MGVAKTSGTTLKQPENFGSSGLLLLAAGKHDLHTTQDVDAVLRDISNRVAL